MEFENLKTRMSSSDGRGHEIIDDLFEVDRDHFPGSGVVFAESYRRRSDCRPSFRSERCSTLPGTSTGGLASGVAKLNSSHTSLCLNKVDDRFEFFDLDVVPESGVVRTDPALRGYGGGLEEDQSGTTDGPAGGDDIPF